MCPLLSPRACPVNWRLEGEVTDISTFLPDTGGPLELGDIEVSFFLISQQRLIFS